MFPTPCDNPISWEDLVARVFSNFEIKVSKKSKMIPPLFSSNSRYSFDTWVLKIRAGKPSFSDACCISLAASLAFLRLSIKSYGTRPFCCGFKRTGDGEPRPLLSLSFS